jgi:hypothetical protein
MQPGFVTRYSTREKCTAIVDVFRYCGLLTASAARAVKAGQIVVDKTKRTGVN